jgi:phosphate transport system permease protein
MFRETSCFLYCNENNNMNEKLKESNADTLLNGEFSEKKGDGFEKENKDNSDVESNQEDVQVKSNEPEKSGSSFRDISLKKRFRLSDYLAEKIITFIAFLSIAIILLIFIFVFRESLPIFLSDEKTFPAGSYIKDKNIKITGIPETKENNSSTSKDIVESKGVQEKYGVEDVQIPLKNTIKQNNKNKKTITEPANQEKPERYGVSENDKPEQYGIVNSEKEEKFGSGEVEKPEQYGSLVKEKTDKSEVNENQKSEKYGIVEKNKSEKLESLNQNKNESTEISSEKQGTTSSFDNETKMKEGNADFKSLSGTEWQPVSDNPRYGLLPLFLGTFKLTLIAILIAAPIGILAALFTAAFAPKWLKEIIKPGIEVLAGFPSVVIGFFALMVMATFFQDLFGYGSRLNGFVGGVAMALAAIPIIYTITEDALTAVPNSYKEASLALGASTWQTAFFVTLPAATPGIFAAILLWVGRVFGETMIALMATGNASLFNLNPFDSVRALSATIGAEMAEVVFGDTHYNVLFLIGSLLFVFTFVLNVIAEFYVRGKLVKRFQGGK